MTLLDILQLLILLYFLLMNGHQILFLLRAQGIMRRHMDTAHAEEVDFLFGSSNYKPISLVCPVFNEGPGVVPSVNSLLALRYPEIQVVVVNDGSHDDTLQKLIQHFRLRPSHRVVRQAVRCKEIRGVYESVFVPNLVVMDKVNGGKSDALNAGLNLAQYPLVCCIDGDSLLENDALLRVVRPFMDIPNTVLCGGVIRPLNGCKVTPMGIRGIGLPSNWLAKFQVMEYLRAFLYGRLGLASFNMLFIVSGAFGLFRRDLLLEAGGFNPKTVGEDFEAVVRMHRHMRELKHPYAIQMVPDPICWTEVPENLKTLHRQRNRWQRGLLDVLWIHKKMMFNPKYGLLGLISLPYFLIFEALAPLIELTGYLIFLVYIIQGNVNTPFALLFLCVAILLGLLNSTVSMMLEVEGGHRYKGLKSFFTLLLTAILENFGYRQLTLFWRLHGTLDWLRGRRQWGAMQRKGINEEKAAPAK